MAIEPILIIGDSGAGKSTSMTWLDPKKTFIQRGTAKAPINVGGVWLHYNEDTDDNPGNTLYVDMPIYMEDGEWKPKLPGMLSYAIQRGFTTFIVDDFQFLLLEVERKLKLSGDYKDARVIYKIIKSYIGGCISAAQAVSNQIRVVFIWQNSSEAGKLVIPGVVFSDEIKPQGFFNVVLEAVKDLQGLFFFKTRGPGMCKTPPNCFEDDLIPNDLDLVFERLDNFYNKKDMFGEMPRFKSSSEQKEYYKKLKEEQAKASNQPSPIKSSTTNQAATTGVEPIVTTTSSSPFTR